MPGPAGILPRLVVRLEASYMATVTILYMTAAIASSSGSTVSPKRATSGYISPSSWDAMVHRPEPHEAPEYCKTAKRKFAEAKCRDRLTTLPW